MKLRKLVSFGEETKGVISPYKKDYEICEYTTKEELDYALDVMRETIPMLQKYTRK